MLGSLAADVAAFGVLGLLIGSFLNVLIHRLPRMLEAAWADDCAEQAGREPEERAPYNLLRPGSRCPHCGHQIRWYENIPVVSYLVLRGRCSECRTPISPRYPAVELITAGLFAIRGPAPRPDAGGPRLGGLRQPADCPVLHRLRYPAASG
jgi:leader peptidase (prepilin peptidase)/N-methyltransferase